MADKENLILQKLDKIFDNISDIKQNVVYLTARDEEHRKNEPVNQARIKELEVRVTDVERDIVEIKSSQSQLKVSFAEHAESDRRYLEEIKVDIERLNDKFDNKIVPLQNDMLKLKTKTGIIAAIAGSIIAFVMSVGVRIVDFFIRG